MFNTHYKQASLSFPPSLTSSISLHSSRFLLSPSSSLHISLLYSIPLFLSLSLLPYFFLTPFLIPSLSPLHSLSLPPSLSPSLSLIFFPPYIFRFFFSSCYKHSLSILRCMTLLIPLSFSPSLFSLFLPILLFLHPSPLLLILYSSLVHIIKQHIFQLLLYAVVATFPCSSSNVHK